MADPTESQSAGLEYPSNANEPKEFVARLHGCGGNINVEFYFERAVPYSLEDEGYEGWTVGLVRGKVPIVTVNHLLELCRLAIPMVQKSMTQQAIQKSKEATLESISKEGRTALPPLWPEAVIDAWADWNSSVRNELRKEGWSFNRCKEIVNSDAWDVWKESRDPKDLEPIKGLLPALLSPEIPVGGTNRYPGVFLVIDKGEYVPGVRKSELVEYHLAKSKFFDGQIAFSTEWVEVDKAYIEKPYAGEHSCRLLVPGRFQEGHWSRGSREHDGKKYGVIRGRLKGATTTTEQAYRYPKTIWTTAQARAHCDDHDGILFEPASEGE